MVKLRTHEDRMSALEEAFDNTGNAMERTAIIESASRLERENAFLIDQSMGNQLHAARARGAN